MYYTFKAQQSQIPDVRVLRGTGVPKITGGFARWDIVERPKRRSVTQFQGIDPITMDVPIIFDGWMKHESVEIKISNLWRMRHVVDDEPPIVRVTGGLPVQNIGWVISNIVEGDNAIWDFNDSGVLVRFRQDATVSLLQKVDAEVVAIGSKQPGSTRGTAAHGAKKGTYRVKSDYPGETLGGIAVRQYGDRAKWRAIAKANNIGDPRSIKKDDVLVLP